MFAENNPTLSQNKEMLMNLSDVLYKIKAIDAIPGDCKYPKNIISSAQNRKQTDTGRLVKCLELKKGTTVMVTVDIDIRDKLIDRQVGKISGFEIVDYIVKRIYIKFHDDLVGREAMSLDSFWFSRWVSTNREC